MMRMLLPFLVAFVVAAGGASGVMVLRARQTVAIPAAAPTVTTADSTAGAMTTALAAGADSTVHDSTADAPAPAKAATTVPSAVRTAALVPDQKRARATASPTYAATAPLDARPPARSRGAAQRATTGTTTETGAGTTAGAASATTMGTATGTAARTPAPTATESATGTASAGPATPDTRMLAIPGLLVGGRLSKIFTSMPSKQAARILQQMGDGDVVVVLSGINDRKAAEILSFLPPERVAVISRSVLALKPAGK